MVSSAEESRIKNYFKNILNAWHGIPRRFAPRDDILFIMPIILVLNLGSTSFKYELFDLESLESLSQGNHTINLSITDYGLRITNLQNEVDKIFREVLRAVGNVAEIKFVGHRFVHGGEKFFQTQKINASDLYELEKLSHLAPLHNPFNLAGIKSSLKYLSEAENYVVFDTAFFKDLPESAKIYPIPYKYYEAGIYKFGFHGISHKFAVDEAAKKIKKDFDKSNFITVHLGGGSSLSAIENGKPIDTSMGMTPMEGLMMMTRSGNVDPGIITRIIADLARISPDKEIQDLIKEVENILNYESGIKGIAGIGDYLELLQAYEKKEKRAVLALEMFIKRIKKYIGAYLALLGRVDAIVFTGKIGAGNPLTRKMICDKMKILEGIKIFVVEPHEELAIAREVKRVINFQ